MKTKTEWGCTLYALLFVPDYFCFVSCILLNMFVKLACYFMPLIFILFWILVHTALKFSIFRTTSVFLQKPCLRSLIIQCYSTLFFLLECFVRVNSSRCIFFPRSAKLYMLGASLSVKTFVVVVGYGIGNRSHFSDI